MEKKCECKDVICKYCWEDFKRLIKRAKVNYRDAIRCREEMEISLRSRDKAVAEVRELLKQKSGFKLPRPVSVRELISNPDPERCYANWDYIHQTERFFRIGGKHFRVILSPFFDNLYEDVEVGFVPAGTLLMPVLILDEKSDTLKYHSIVDNVVVGLKVFLDNVELCATCGIGKEFIAWAKIMSYPLTFSKLKLFYKIKKGGVNNVKR